MNPLRGRRQWGRRAAISTGSAAATLASARVIEDGGTAFDAAITASAVMMVALPAANGPGGDMAAVVRDAPSGRWWSLTGLGRAPGRAAPEEFRRRGQGTVPETGILSVATPGVVDGWYRLHRERGTMPLERLLAPAVDLALAGICVSDQNRRWTADNHPVLVQREMRDLYAPCLDPGSLGGLMPQPGLAHLLTLVAERSPAALRALLAEAVVDVSRSLDGLLEPEDLLHDVSRFGRTASWVHDGREIHTNPAPTQGPVFLQHLALADRAGASRGRDDADRIHVLGEVVNQSYGWRLRCLGDPSQVVVPDPLQASTLDELAAGVDPARRSPSVCGGAYDEGDTTHFVIADSAGRAVSWIQSLGLGFGSGVGVPELGLLLSNRLGRSCTVRPSDPNSVAPGRTPVNTIFAWSADSGDVVRAGGTPGGDGQTQWNLQTVRGLSEGLDLVDALGRPKWTYYPGADKAEAGEIGEQLWVDTELDAETIAGLRARGHDVVRRPTVGGATRVVEIGRAAMLVLDDGRQEGLTIAL